MASPKPRIGSFTEFWPYYISEHRVPLDRHLHFVGTSTFLAVQAYCVATTPLPSGPALVAVLVLGALLWGMEARRSAAPVLLGMIALAGLANPVALLGVVAAYAFAWAGHFLVEKNRPATFVYPLWSLAGDFRMYSEMLRGRLWTGDGSEIAPRSAAAK